MNSFVTLMRREWLQHRLGWTIAALLPLAIALLLVSFGLIVIGDASTSKFGAALPALLAMIAIVGGTALSFLILTLTSWIIVGGLARRDHGDRSVEFWLSLPVGHVQSLAVPLLVHLILVPAAALLVGLAGGYLLSLVLVGRIVGISEWLALPWADIFPASLALVLRLLAGLPLATLWLAPLILLVVLLTAWFRRWGWVILVVGIGVGSELLNRVFGQPLLSDILLALLAHAATAMVHGVQDGGGNLRIQGASEGFAALRGLPGWALRDLGGSLRELASPLLLGGLVFAAGCFALLVDWRQRGASAAA
ncbi:MAG TPA: hypothetical protein VEZ89_06170 [Rubrivivax sp.]|nr:hypothetical protein [Rubrivivax sp.]